MRIKIIYEDAGVLVCYKPAGLAVQTADHFQEDAVSGLKNYLSEKSGTKNPYLGIVHRLDQSVEGLLVFAKTKKAAAALTGELAEGKLTKKYLALLSGVPEKKSGILIDYLKKDGKKGMAFVVPETDPDGRRSELSYQILAEAEREEGMCSLAEIEIATGRFHQIRIQMAHMGHPLLGDGKYGASIKGTPALCAYELTFENPLTKKRQGFFCQPENPAFLQFADVIKERSREIKKNKIE